MRNAVFHKPFQFDLYSKEIQGYYRAAVACPYFYPSEKNRTIAWAFPARLPLGAGFNGTCRASCQEISPTETELRDYCNIGYARGCSHMPETRLLDGARFAIARDEESRIILHYVNERDHEPVEYGRLEYDCIARSWPVPLHDDCLQRQAECYLAAYLERRPRKSI